MKAWDNKYRKHRLFRVVRDGDGRALDALAGAGLGDMVNSLRTAREVERALRREGGDMVDVATKFLTPSGNIGERALDLGLKSADALYDALTGRTRAEYQRAVDYIGKQDSMMGQMSAAQQAQARTDALRDVRQQERVAEEQMRLRPVYLKYGWDNLNLDDLRAKQLATYDEKRALAENLAKTGLWDERDLMRLDLPLLWERAQRL